MNLTHSTWDAELPSEGGTLRSARLAEHAGAQRLAANLYELDQGAVVSPLHFHHANEELLFVLSGTPTPPNRPFSLRTRPRSCCRSTRRCCLSLPRRMSCPDGSSAATGASHATLC